MHHPVPWRICLCPKHRFFGSGRQPAECKFYEKVFFVESAEEAQMEACEPLRDAFALEELAIPENLSDPAGVVDLWLADARSHGLDGEIVVRGKAGVPTSLALECDAYELYRMLGEELLEPELFSHASYAATVVGVLGRTADERGVPRRSRHGRTDAAEATRRGDLRMRVRRRALEQTVGNKRNINETRRREGGRGGLGAAVAYCLRRESRGHGGLAGTTRDALGSHGSPLREGSQL